MFNKTSIIQGSILLSEPFMLDPTFERSVILLCEHDDNGTLGFILNSITHLTLSDLIEGLNNQNFPIYIGGPVESNMLFFIHKAYDKLQSGTLIKDDIYLGGDFDKLIELIEDDLIDNTQIKFFLGYTGWSKDQLENEINENSWASHQAFDDSILFISDGENLWKQALINLGPKYAHVANFPKRPDLN